MAGPHLNVLQNSRRALPMIQARAPPGPPVLDNRLMESLGCMGGCGACPKRMGCGGGKPSEAIAPASPLVTISDLDSLLAPAESKDARHLPPLAPKESAPVKTLEQSQPALPTGAEMSVLAWLAEMDLRKQKSGIRYSCELFLKDGVPSSVQQDMQVMKPPRTPDYGSAIRLDGRRADAPKIGPGQAMQEIPARETLPPSSSPLATESSPAPSEAPLYLPPEETPVVCQYAIAKISRFVLRDAAAQKIVMAKPPPSGLGMRLPDKPARASVRKVPEHRTTNPVTPSPGRPGTDFKRTGIPGTLRGSSFVPIPYRIRKKQVPQGVKEREAGPAIPASAVRKIAVVRNEPPSIGIAASRRRRIRPVDAPSIPSPAWKQKVSIKERERTARIPAARPAINKTLAVPTDRKPRKIYQILSILKDALSRRRRSSGPANRKGSDKPL